MDNSDEKLRRDSSGRELPSSVAPIVDSFAGRISKRLEEKERAENASAQAAQERYQLVMQGLTIIRKALQEACKIKLGGRFSLASTITDSDGWPKITLQVRDQLAPGWNELFIQAHANDRQGEGLLTIDNQTGQRLLQLSVTERDPLQRLPIHLKKALRTFLDQVGTYVVDPRRPEDLVAVQTKSIETVDEHEPGIENPLSSENVFQEDHSFSKREVVEQTETKPLAVDLFSAKNSAE